MISQPTAVTAYDLFVSYAEADRAWVDGFLLDALEQAGVTYHSEDAFALGVPRLVEFERAIQQSTRTLLILSPAYLTDTFGQFVDVLVNSYGMETATWPVIPLILQPIDTLPPRLSQLVRLDATSTAGQQAALAKLCVELERPVPGPAPLPDCPYPGMVPFDEADSARFFGREQEVQELVERLRLQPFLAVIGASGSGKSSLVRAGLIPALRKSRLFGAGEWIVRVMRPGATPFAALSDALGIAPTPAPAKPPQPPPDDLLAALLISTETTAPSQSNGSHAPNKRLDSSTGGSSAPLVIDATQAVPAMLATQPDARRLLLLVDQFEETFTLAGEQGSPFQQALLDLAATANCYVALTVRADFYADLMTSPLWSEIQAHRAEVTPLGETGLRRAIVRPAEQAGVAIEAALVERLLSDAAGEPGVLPLVQETLVLLWERLERRFLPMRAYEALVLTRDSYSSQLTGERSGLQVAIARRADATLADLAEAQQTIARRIFLRLIQFGEGRADTRRQQSVGALQSAGDDPRLFDQTLQRLAASRLITLSGGPTTDHRPPTINQRDNPPSSVVGRPSSALVDIAHEALIRGWPALQGWLKERREGELTRRRLEDKAQEWVRLGRGNGGLLDEIEVLEAERWLQSPDADEMGFDAALPELVVWSRAELEAAEQAREAARQRELAQAQALAEEQQQRAEEQAAAGKRLRQRAVYLSVALAAAVVAVVVAIIFGINANIKERLAQTKTRQARAGELAAQAKGAADVFPQRSLLLALEAIKTTRDAGESVGVTAQQALYDALLRLGGRGLVTHYSFIYQSDSSPDGRYFAVKGDRYTIYVWDLRAADVAIPLIIHSNHGGGDLRFLADGRLLSAGVDGTLSIWDLHSSDPAAAALVLSDDDRDIQLLELSPDRQIVATFDTANIIRIWRLGDSDPARNLRILRGNKAAISNIRFSPNGRFLAAADRQDTAVYLWDLQAAGTTIAAQLLPGHQHNISALEFGPDGQLFSGDEAGLVQMWDTRAAGPSIKAVYLQGIEEQVSRLNFTPNGWAVAAFGSRGALQAWNIRAGDPVASRLSLSDEKTEQTFLGISPDGRIITGRPDGTVRLSNISSATAPDDALVLQGHQGRVARITFSPDGRLVTIGSDGTIRLWDLHRPNPAKGALVLHSHDEQINNLLFVADGQLVVVTHSNVRLWDIKANAVSAGTQMLSGFGREVRALAFSSDGQLMAGDTNGKLHIWTRDTSDQLQPAQVLPISTASIEALEFSPNGRLITSDADGNVRLLNMSLADPLTNIQELPGHVASNVAFGLSPDGRLVTADDQGILRLWNVAADNPADTMQILNQATGSEEPPIVALAVGRAGKLVVSKAGVLTELRDLNEAKPAAVVHDLGIKVWALAFSPDGQLVAGDTGGAVQFWKLDADGTATNNLVLRGHTGSVTKLAFSSDGRLLAVAGDNGTIWVWNMSAADPTAGALALHGHSGQVNALAFSPDGRLLASAGHDGTVRVWLLDLDKQVEQSCRIVGRNLTLDEWQQAFGRDTYRRTCGELPVHPTVLEDKLFIASKQVLAGKIAEAIAGIKEVQKLNPDYVISADNWDTLCRVGVLGGQVKNVLEACGQAVALAPYHAGYHDSRGLARALTGDPTGAIEDFEFYINWPRDQADTDTLQPQIAQRKQWVTDLKAGRNPFDQATMEKLKGER